MSVYPKRIYPRGYGFPGVTVNSEYEEERALGIIHAIPDQIDPLPELTLSPTSATKAPVPKQEKKANKSKQEKKAAKSKRK